MSDRVVTYDFRGNFSNLGAGLVTMGKGVGDLGVKLTALDKQGATYRRGLDQIGGTAGRAGLVAAAGFGLIVRSAANFDQAMSNVAATGNDARGSLDELRQAALDAGAATKFSATEAAEGVENLLKAGVSAQDVLDGGLSGALDLAAAGGLQVADAAEIAATALTQFKLEGEDVPHVADLLAAAAGKAQGDVSDMSMALKQSGLVASQMGVSIEETTGTLAAFASAGLLGSDAGTSFRTMLLRLANPTEESKKLMDSLGIAAYDASGQFVGMASIAGQLQTAFEGKTQAERDSALATIFGSDAIRAASVLYAQGAGGVNQWTSNVDDAGYAAETASIKMDNLKGDIEQLGGALETALIGSGDGSQGVLRGITQAATSMVNVFNDAPSGLQNTATGLLAITAVTGGSLWFGSKVIQSVANTRQALADLGVESGRTAGRLGTVAKAGGGLVALVTVADLLQAAMSKLADTDLDGSLNRDLEALNNGEITQNVDRLRQSFSDLNATGAGLAKFNPLSWVSSFDPQGVEAAEKNVKQLDEALANLAESGQTDAAAESFRQLSDLWVKEGGSLAEFASRFPQYTTALDNLGAAAEAAKNRSSFEWLYGLGAAADDTAAATQGLTEVTDGSTDAQKGQTQALNDATQAMRDKRDETLAAFDAETRWGQAVDDAKAAVAEGRKGINRFTEDGRANRDALSSLADAWNQQSTAVKNNSDRYAAARKTFIETATAMGVPKKAAQELANQLLQIPRSTVAKVTADTSAAEHALDNLTRPRKVTITAVTVNGHTSSTVEPHYSNPNPDPGRLASRGLNLVTPRRSDLAAAADKAASVGLTQLNKESEKAGHGLKSLQEKLDKASKAADKAHDALDDLRDQRSGLSSSVTGSITHDPFGGGLQDFNAQIGADANDARALLAALKTLVRNGLDPHSDLFKRLAASGNLSLVQEFAALSRSQLKAEQAAYTSAQGALTQVGQYAGNQAFGDLISAQRDVTEHLDATVRDLAQQIKKLEKAVERGAEKGSRSGSQAGSHAGSQAGTWAGMRDRDKRSATSVRTGARR